jgi:hypothetical protein
MSVASGLASGYSPNVYRTVAASTDLKTVSGAPQRCAARLLITNANAAVQTAIFTGPDAVNVTIAIPTMTTIEIHGVFSTTGAFSDALVTCVAGWIDDGSVRVT